MKKLLSLLAAFTLIFGFSVNALASITPVYDDWSPITINKALTATPTGSNPEETFNFTIGNGSGIRDGVTLTAPAFSPATFSITVLEGEITGNASINFPTFTEVGEFTYEVREVKGDTAGFDYDAAPYYLKITVVNNPAYPGIVPGTEDPEPEFLRVLTLYAAEMIEVEGEMVPNPDVFGVKTDEFMNSFDAGDLTIKKKSVGNFADPDDEFTVTVTLTPKSGFVLNDDVIEATGADSYSQDATTGVVTIVYTVKDGSEFTITDIPYDVLYTVEESANTMDYVVTYDGKESGEINARLIETMITNTRNKTIDTGISLDSLPYILLLGFAVLGMGVLFFRKRQNANF